MVRAAPLLADLREPPVVGQFYMVPTVHWLWGQAIVDEWPVLGPRHDDRDYFGFDFPHFHLDVRFIGPSLATRLLHHVRHHEGIPSLRSDEERLVMIGSAWPLFSVVRDDPLPRPVLRRRRCHRADIRTLMPEQARDQVAAMAATYGSPAEPIRTKDGRLLCPHRKVDLSQFAADAEGNVICPLHGLTVKCREVAAHG